MIVLTGDSHVGALRLGAQILSDRHQIPSDLDLRIRALGNGKHALQEFSDVRDGKVVVTQPDFADALRRLTGQNHFIASKDVRYGICLGFHSPPVFRHPQWKRYRPTDLVTAPRAQRPISSAALDVMVEHYDQHILRLFERLVDQGVDFFVISAPPPRSDHWCLADTPAEVVLGVDRAFRSFVRSRLDAMGVRSVLPPAAVFDEAGFLREEYANLAPRDPHHGNAAYGAVMMPAVLDAVVDAPGTLLRTGATSGG